MFGIPSGETLTPFHRRPALRAFPLFGKAGRNVNRNYSPVSIVRLLCELNQRFLDRDNGRLRSYDVAEAAVVFPKCDVETFHVTPHMSGFHEYLKDVNTSLPLAVFHRAPWGVNARGGVLTSGGAWHKLGPMSNENGIAQDASLDAIVEALPPSPPRSKRGFASLSPERLKELSSKGGKTAQALGTSHRFTPEEARAAGRKGGLASQVAFQAAKASKEAQ